MSVAYGDYECAVPLTYNLRKRKVEKSINSDELVSLAYTKLAIAKDVQLENERNGINENSDIILMEGVSRKKFIEWTVENHYGLRPTFLPTGFNESGDPIGNITITECASGPHEIAAGYVAISIRDQLSDISRNLRNSIMPESCKTIIWNNGVVKIPDGGLTFGAADPIVVIESAYSQPFPSLQSIVRDWIVQTNHVQISIGIKMFPKKREMIILYHDRRDTTNEIEFGVSPAPAPLPIPVALLYTEIPPELQNIEFVDIDLVRLREWILAKMEFQEN